MEMRGMSGELLGTIGTSNPSEVSKTLYAKPQEPKASTSTTTSRNTAFTTKKRKILDALYPPADRDYIDKSPKGSVDAEIVDLIDEINAYEGLVTTSSCAGRVSVFLVGEKKGRGTREGDEEEHDKSTDVPGGKGLGGRWLFVSHEPVGRVEGRNLMELFGLVPSPSALSTAGVPRLVKFAFEPLILHVLCANLRHAQPLLAAAINAGFRESGVQSLKILDEKDGESQGAMVGIRTAGLGFECVVGVYERGPDGAYEESSRALVSEDYLALMVRVSEERFKANEERRERFRTELKEHMTKFENQEQGANGWEDKDARARRKRVEGLRRQEIARSERSEV
jgi:tRNA wybutosine-synthesizing protein 3